MCERMAETELVTSFYSSAAGETTWPETLERAARYFKSQATIYVVHKPGTMDAIAMQSHNYSHEFLASFFAGEAYARDPRNARIGQVRPGSIFFDEILYDVEEMRRDKWVGATTSLLQMHAQVGARLRLPDGGEATLCMMRKERETDTLAARARVMRRLAPRIEQASALGYLLEREWATRAALLECLAAKADAVILLDLFGRPSFMNDAARRMLAAGDGLKLAGETLQAARRPEALALRRLVSQTLAGLGGDDARSGGRVLVSRVSRRKPYVVTVMPSPAREAFLAGHSIACVIHIQDLATPPSPQAADLGSVFGLTRRESELAADLARAAQLDVAAARCGMAVNTARNHLQSIFAKTDTSGQAELVQLLGRIL